MTRDVNQKMAITRQMITALTTKIWQEGIGVGCAFPPGTGTIL